VSTTLEDILQVENIVSAAANPKNVAILEYFKDPALIVQIVKYIALSDSDLAIERMLEFSLISFPNSFLFLHRSGIFGHVIAYWCLFPALNASYSFGTIHYRF
jgi:hypothetical protein